MKKIIILCSIICILCVGCGNKESKYGNLKIGDYINYDAGEWSDEDLLNIENENRPSEQGQFSLYKLVSGASKNDSVTSGCYKDDNYSTNSGWRVISISNDEISIIHAGVPTCYYHLIADDDTNQKASIKNMDEFVNKYFVNSKYATSGRNNICSDYFKTDVCAYGKNSLSEEYLKEEVYADKTIYDTGDNYWLSSPSNINRLWDWNQDYYGFSNHDTHPYGIRPVVTLSREVILDDTGDGTKDNPYGIKVSK